MSSKAPADHKRARQLIRQAMDAGHVEAKNAYATVLTMGIGGPTDPKQARRLREAAAAAGSEGANLTLMEMHLAGADGYPKDSAKAYAFARAAADSPLTAPRNHCFAQWKVGMMALGGIGTAKDSRTAYSRFKRSADDGCADGMISQAVMLATGDGVAEDDGAARALYTKASESGDRGFAHALRGLGAMMVVGEGGPVDVPRGMAYLMIAAAGGDRMALPLLEGFKASVSSADQKRIPPIYEAWIAEHFHKRDL